MTAFIVFTAKYVIWGIVALAGMYFLFITRAKRQMLFLSILSLPFAYIVARVAGALYYDPRPFVINGTQPLVAHAADNGFPSDHMLLGATLASIVFVYNRPVGVLLWLLAIAVGAARVAAGVHHMLDIVGSAIIGLVSVWVVYLCIRSARWYRG